MVVITQYLQGLYHPIWFGGSILCRSCKNFEKLESRSLDILGKKYRWQKGGCESITKIIGATGQISHIFHIYFTNLDFLGEIFRGPFWNPSKKCYLLIGGIWWIGRRDVWRRRVTRCLWANPPLQLDWVSIHYRCKMALQILGGTAGNCR